MKLALHPSEERFFILAITYLRRLEGQQVSEGRHPERPTPNVVTPPQVRSMLERLLDDAWYAGLLTADQVERMRDVAWHHITIGGITLAAWERGDRFLPIRHGA